MDNITAKKVNRFIVMCVEQYAAFFKLPSETVYKNMKEKGAIEELIFDYEDLHGMSTEYLNQYIQSLLR